MCQLNTRAGVTCHTAAGNVASLTFTRKCLLRAFDCGCGNGFLFSRRPRPLSDRDRCRSFASVRKMTSKARIRREKQKIRSFCFHTLSLEPWRSRQFGLLSRPGPCRSESVLFWRAASSGGLRDNTAAGNVASLTFTQKCLLRAFDCGCGNGILFSRRPRPVSDRDR